jgi:molybdopterin-guanine dinucleotide biosynthesis protein A
MKCNVPKALVPITDEPCLTTSLQQIGHKFRRVFIVTNVVVQDQWTTYFRALEAVYPELAQQVVNLPIRSGLGDGHAALQGIVAADRIEGGRLQRDMVVAWGDVFFPKGEFIDELLSIPQKGSGLLPAVRECQPYVSLLVNDEMQCVAADFSKYGENRISGFHDQSVFRFDLPRLRRALCDLHNALWKNDRYIAPGGELSLLYTFHQLYNTADPAYVYEAKYTTLSFNTVEEVAAIQREIGAEWRSRFRSNWSAAAVGLAHGVTPLPRAGKSGAVRS